MGCFFDLFGHLGDIVVAIRSWTMCPIQREAGKECGAGTSSVQEEAGMA